MFTHKISGKFIRKVPQKVRIEINNFVDLLTIQRKENTSGSDTLFVLAFICYQLSLLLIRSSCLVYPHIHNPCRSSQRRPVLRITFKNNLSKLIKRKKYSSCSIMILFYTTTFSQNKKRICQLKHQSKSAKKFFVIY